MATDNKKTTCPPCKKTSIGGQALMEGIMMRGPEKTSMAVRNAKGEIILETSNTIPMTAKVYKIPFVRGIFNMGASLVQGYKCLMRSADIALADADEADKKAAAEKAARKAAKKAKKKGIETAPEAVEPEVAKSSSTEEVIPTEEVVPTEEVTPTEEVVPTEEVTQVEETATDDKDKKKNQGGFATTLVMVLGVVLGIGLALALFIALPSYLFELFAKLVKLDLTDTSYGMNLLRSAFEGVLKIILLIVYMLAVSFMKDIRRVFMYHGAEHKTIFCYEQGLDLTVENVRKQKRFHPRCGTSFLILVLLVSMVIGFFIPASLHVGLRILLKIALLPLTIGIGYELIKLAGRKDNLFTKITSAPGVWLQHITTVEPDDSMIECAIAAMKEVIPEDKNADNW